MIEGLDKNIFLRTLLEKQLHRNIKLKEKVNQRSRY